MAEIELKAQIRQTLGKKVRFLRRENSTPANIYGPNTPSIPIQVETRTLLKVLAQAGANLPISLRLDEEGNPRYTFARGIQRDPRTWNLLHVDFYQVDMTRTMRTEVPIRLVGEAPAAKAKGGLAVQHLNLIHVECLPTDIPRVVEVDISRLEDMDQEIRIADIAVSPKIKVLTNPKELVVKVHPPRVEEAVEVTAKVEEKAEVEEKVEPEAKAEAAAKPKESKKK